MIRNYLLPLLFILMISTCAGPQAPIFKRVDGLKATKISTRQITISGEAVYHNPNGISLTLTTTDIDVILNDIPAAKINQDLEIEVPAQAEFRVPITFSAKPQDVYAADKGGVIGGAINALLNKKIDVRYEGTITVKMAGIPYTAPIEYEEEVAL